MPPSGTGPSGQKTRKDHGTSQRPQDLTKRFVTLSKKLADVALKLRDAHAGGEVVRFIIAVQDHQKVLYGDASPDLQHFFRHEDGLTRVFRDSNEGKYRNSATSLADTSKLQGVYPTRGSAAKVLNATDVRLLLRSLKWNEVRKALQKDDVPSHMSQFTNKRDVLFKSVQHHDLLSSGGQESEDETSAHAGGLPQKRARNEGGRFQHEIEDHDDLLDMSSWKEMQISDSHASEHINFSSLLSKKVNDLNLSQGFAAIGICLEYHNPGTCIHTYTCMDTCIHTYIHIVHSYIHAHVCMHVYIHTHIKSQGIV
jgi:hypothetical protein